MADEPNIVVEFTRKEAELVWDIMAKYAQQTFPFDRAHEMKTSQNVLFKITAAAKAVEYPLPGAPI